MGKLNVADLDAIKGRVQKGAELKKGGDKRARIIVHMGTCGIASGAKDVMAELVKVVEEKNITDVVLTSSGCAGMCSHEPMITVELPEEPAVKYVKLSPEKAREVFEEHVENGNVLNKYALAMGPEKAY